MTGDETEKRIGFIIEQQAQFAVDLQQLGEAQSRTNEMLNRLAAVTLEGFKDVNAKIDALVDSHIRLTESQARTDENLKLTDEKLRNLIAVVDRYFSEGRNGRSEN
jgi:ABC-type transporter Mla subunit MlaD